MVDFYFFRYGSQNKRNQSIKIRNNEIHIRDLRGYPILQNLKRNGLHSILGGRLFHENIRLCLTYYTVYRIVLAGKAVEGGISPHSPPDARLLTHSTPKIRRVASMYPTTLVCHRPNLPRSSPTSGSPALFTTVFSTLPLVIISDLWPVGWAGWAFAPNN